MEHSTSRSLAVSMTAFLLTGCFMEWPEPMQDGHACIDSGDCAINWQCVDAICVQERLMVEAVRPPDRAQHVHPATMIEIVFNKTYDLESVTRPGGFSLIPEGGSEADSVPVTISLRQEGPEIVEIHPNRPLDPDRVYIARLDKDVTGLFGDTMGKDYLWSFRVEDVAWQPAEVIAGQAWDVSVGAAAGIRKIVWVEEGNALGFSTWTGNQWSTPGRLERGSPPSKPTVGGALCDDDAPCLAWVENGIHLRWRSINGWVDTEIEDDEFADFPTLAAAPGGPTFVVHKSSQGVVLFEHNGGNSLLDDSSGVTSAPLIGVGALGRPVVAWEEIAGARVWSFEIRAQHAGPIVSGSLGLSVSPGGRALLHWIASTEAVLNATSFPTGSGEPVPVAHDVTAADGALGASGGLLVWTTTLDQELVVRPVPPPAQWPFEDQPNFGSPETIQSIGAGGPTISSPKVAVDERGGAVVIWLENEDALWARRRPAGAEGWSEIHRLDLHMPPADPITELHLAMDAAGRGVVVWREDGRIWAARFE